VTFGVKPCGLASPWELNHVVLHQYESKQAGVGDLKALGAWIEVRLRGLDGPHVAWHSALSPRGKLLSTQ